MTVMQTGQKENMEEKMRKKLMMKPAGKKEEMKKPRKRVTRKKKEGTMKKRNGRRKMGKVRKVTDEGEAEEAPRPVIQTEADDGDLAVPEHRGAVFRQHILEGFIVQV
jgi:hypothetical protein